MKSDTYESSPRDMQQDEKVELIRKPFPPEPLTEEEKASLRQLASKDDSEINTEDIPELPADRPYIFNPYLPASARFKKAS